MKRSIRPPGQQPAVLACRMGDISNRLHLISSFVDQSKSFAANARLSHLHILINSSHHFHLTQTPVQVNIITFLFKNHANILRIMLRHSTESQNVGGPVEIPVFPSCHNLSADFALLEKPNDQGGIPVSTPFRDDDYKVS